jgi:Lsr2
MQDMATHTEVIVIDDMDGKSIATRTMAFALAGESFEIDLSDEHLKEMHEAVAPFIAAARRLQQQRRQAPRTTASRERSREARVWAKEAGVPVNPRGRVSELVMQRFEAAQVNGHNGGSQKDQEPSAAEPDVIRP